MDNIHGRTTSGVTCNHHPWKVYAIGRCRVLQMVGRDHACYVIIAIGKHKRSDDVGRYMPSFPCTTLMVGRLQRGMALSHLDSIYGRRMSGEAFHHGHWQEHTIERRPAWQSIIALEQHRQG
uniref:Uncharacterized protein n=1 Tax=Solanum lycopersicum TaxID=4081 RepID=A0A494G8G6_SOLLC